jgi:hypothetical protein
VQNMKKKKSFENSKNKTQKVLNGFSFKNKKC